jgi:hypothetical protein
MIERVIEDWHRYMKGELPGGLDALLSDDVVFYSPIVFTPQRGKAITKLYLTAAGSTLGGDEPKAGAADASAGAAPTKFRYVKEILAGHQAMLEFETSMDGKYVNGVDIITCDDSGKIIEFKVMIRPLQAINLVHQQMKAMLESMS